MSSTRLAACVLLLFAVAVPPVNPGACSWLATPGASVLDARHPSWRLCAQAGLALKGGCGEEKDVPVEEPAALKSVHGGCDEEGDATLEEPSALTSVRIELLTEKGEEGELYCAFPPLYAHQVFGQNETLPSGCDAVNISYSAISLLPSVTVSGPDTSAAEACIRTGCPADYAESRDVVLSEARNATATTLDAWKLVASYGEGELSGRSALAVEALQLRRGGRTSRFEVRLLPPPPLLASRERQEGAEGGPRYGRPES